MWKGGCDSHRGAAKILSRTAVQLEKQLADGLLLLAPSGLLSALLLRPHPSWVSISKGWQEYLTISAQSRTPVMGIYVPKPSVALAEAGHLSLHHLALLAPPCFLDITSSPSRPPCLSLLCP